MTYTPIVFTDLDDTIFASPEHYPGRELTSLILSSRKGRLSEGYMCERRDDICKWLKTGATVIPVTAREKSSYEDVDIPFMDGAIVANGTIILNAKGEEDTQWQSLMEEKLLEAREALDAVQARLQAFDKKSTLFQIDLYWSGSHAYGMTAKVLDQTLDQNLLENELRDHLQHDGLLDYVRPSWVNEYLGFMPNGIGKGPAVSYMLETNPEFQNRPTIGMGDALTDLEFMSLCDLMVVPQNSKNAKKLLG